MSQLRSGTAPPEHVSPRWQACLHHDLSDLETVWRRAEATGWVTAFQRFDWAMTLVDAVARKRGIETFAMEVSDEAGHTLMLLPFARERRRGITTLSILNLDVCDYLAPVLLPGAAFPPERAAELWAVIRAALPRADLVVIPKMPASIAGRPNPLIGLGTIREMTTRRYGLAIAPPAGDLLQRVTPPSSFQNLAVRKRRLAKRGKIGFVAASTPAEVDSIAGAMISQRRERFRELGRQNLMDLPEIEDFYRKAARSGLAGGPARIFGLSVDGEWVGTLYGLVHGTSLSLVAQTMAGGAWRNCSPGLLTTAATMEWAAEQGLTYFDFSIGFLPYKLELGAAEGTLFELSEALTRRGALVLATAWVLPSVKAALGRYPRLYEIMRSGWRRLRRS